jgi:5-methylcytosine-specific restriction endonuclease McrA
MISKRRRAGREWRGKREYLFLRENGCCFYCNRPVEFRGWSWPYKGPEIDDATIDHIIPHSKGGSNRNDNLLLSCRGCNEERDTMDATEFFLLKNPLTILSKI